jgi:hypothetical protein
VLATAALVHWLRWPKGFFGSVELGHTFGILGSWDGVWYRTVATQGYLLIPGRQSDPAFFPLYPILLRGAHTLGLPYLAAGIVISNLAFAIAVIGLYELGRSVVPEDVAWRAALLAAAFPVGFVFSMLYPESIVFAALVLALLFAVRGRWLASAAAGSIAALGRPEAVLFVIPVAALAYERWRQLTPQQRAEAFGAVVAPGAAAATFPLYLGWTLHNFYAWSWAQRAWGRSFQPTGIVNAFTRLGTFVGANHWLIRDVVFAGLYVVLLVLARRVGIGLAWIAAGALIVLLPLTSGSFVSDSRFGLLAIPAYWGLASLARGRGALVALLSLSTMLLVAGTMTLPWMYP